jgi:hypothetical protein
MNDQPGSTPTPQPARASRRSFLLQAAAGAGASAVGAAALASGLAPAASHRPAEAVAAPLDDGPVPGGAVVAYVRDASSGEISLLAGDREVLITDHSLARLLARKAR